jgi:hypothetical protein
MHKLALVLLCCTWISSASSTQAAPPDPLERDLATLREAGLAVDDDALMDFFKKRTLREADREKIQSLVKQLGDDSFEVRERATQMLITIGPAAEAQLKQAAESSDPEVKQRASVCLASLTKIASSGVIHAAVRVLEAHKPKGAAEVLFNYLPFVADESTADAVRTALAKVAVNDGKPDKLLLDGLEDKVPSKRLGAALALYRTGLKDVRPALLKLLKDPDADIRFRFALMLGESKERDAVPALIEMIPDLKPHELRQAVDFLEQVAQDKGPKPPQGSTDAKQLRENWSAWWQDNGQKIDFTKLDLTPKVLGRTLILDRAAGPGAKALGRVYEIDKEGQTLWQVEGIRYPLDAKILGDDRVLISESLTRMVTERNFKGEVLWQYQAQTAAYNVQRLPNGNTFLNCRSFLIEVDKDGKEVLRHDLNGGACASAQKLKNGDIAMINLAGQYSVLSPDKKELKTFKTEILPTLNGADLLPGGGVIVANSQAGKVVEYDAEGKAIWEATVQSPYGVSRMPNGNVLVTSLATRSIIELDREGKEVSKRNVEGRPYKAFGR